MVETVAVLGRGFLEGPVWRPETGDLLITEVTTGQILRIDVSSGAANEFAHTGGGPSGAWPCADGGLLVAQNGGLDWDSMGFSAPPDASQPAVAGIQRVMSTGELSLLTEGDGPFRAPNDLFVTADGTVWFTDPPSFPAPPDPVGRVWRWRPGERAQAVTDGLTYCNGIVVDEDGTIVVVEGLGSIGLLRLGTDGSERDWLVEHLPRGGDGMAYDDDGNLYVAGGAGITVVSPSGEVIDSLDAPDVSGLLTNCCFGGDDRRTLFATDGGGSRVLAFPDRPVAGRLLTPMQPEAQVDDADGRRASHQPSIGSGSTP